MHVLKFFVFAGLSALLLLGFHVKRCSAEVGQRLSSASAAYAARPMAPALVDPAIEPQVTEVRAALAPVPELRDAFDAAYAPFLQAEHSEKHYRQALVGLQKITKMRLWRGTPKRVRQEMRQLVNRLRRAVTEFIALRPFVLNDPRQNAAALLRQQVRSRRVSKVALALATLLFGGAVLGGAGYWAVKEINKPSWQGFGFSKAASTKSFNALVSGWGCSPDDIRVSPYA